MRLPENRRKNPIAQRTTHETRTRAETLGKKDWAATLKQGT